jgi:hypothetical protein
VSADDGDGTAGPPVEAPATIMCVDCGGTCHLLTPPRIDADAAGDTIGHRSGDIVAYRCEDCLDRWDVELA